VRGDVLESAQIVFYYIREAILHCHPRLFFKHRGIFLYHTVQDRDAVTTSRPCIR